MLPEQRRSTTDFFRRVWQNVQKQFIEDVPADIGLCEFDCRKPECSMGEWQNCDRRIVKAAGELSPGGDSPNRPV